MRMPNPASPAVEAVTRTSRRQFLRQTATVATLAACPVVAASTPAQAQEKKNPASSPALPIVDTHQHLWDLSKVRLPWLESAGLPLNRSHVTRDYLQATQGLNVVKSVYMEVDVAADCKLTEADYVLEICRRADTPMVAAVIGGDPTSDSFRQYMTQFKDNPYIKGIRRIMSSAELFADAKFRRAIQFLGDLGMSFDLCHPPQWLPDSARLVDACPGTRFILDHCGNADVKSFLPPGNDEPATQVIARQQQCDRWRRDIAALARRKNVVCKISGIIASAPKDHWTPEHLAPIVHHCLDVFGPDRAMFAGDWPVCTRVATFRQWVEALKQITRDRTPIEQRKLFHDNAVRCYGLR